MALVFKSPPEERVIIERGRDGTQRVCKARQDDANEKMWRLRLEHPSGMHWDGSFYGDGNTVQVAMTQMMMDKENDYKDEAARGHTPAPEMRDTNVRVDAFGENIAPPIRSYIRR